MQRFVYTYWHNILRLLDSLSVAVDSLSSTHLNISWVLDYRLITTSYTISYSNTGNTWCFTDSGNITGVAASETMYTLNLQEDTAYSITVTALLSGGETAEESLTATTMTAGQLFPLPFPSSNCSFEH